MVLILSLAKSFNETMKTQQYPSHLITFRKQDLLSNIKDIDVGLINFREFSEINFNCSSNYLSKLESLGKSNSFFKFHESFSSFN